MNLGQYVAFAALFFSKRRITKTNRGKPQNRREKKTTTRNDWKVYQPFPMLFLESRQFNCQEKLYTRCKDSISYKDIFVCYKNSQRIVGWFVASVKWENQMEWQKKNTMKNLMLLNNINKLNRTLFQFIVHRSIDCNPS